MQQIDWHKELQLEPAVPAWKVKLFKDLRRYGWSAGILRLSN